MQSTMDESKNKAIIMFSRIRFLGVCLSLKVCLKFLRTLSKEAPALLEVEETDMLPALPPFK